MDERLQAMTEGLGPLLIEARNLMHLQERAIASGIRIDSSFVRCRIDGWDHAISGVRETFASLGAAVNSSGVRD
ncbi:MAG: hypothetical protein ABSA13_09415 [Beijerinckiaceae bacterium]|jgi:hypothetical protein